MALTLKTAEGGPDTNSYNTVAEAESYLAEFPYDLTDWYALTKAEKVLRLVLAADLMSYLSWRGYKAYQYQALSLPRRNCQELFGYALNMIPPEVKRAHAVIAYTVVHRNIANLPAISETTGKSRVSGFSISGLSISLHGLLADTGSDFEDYIRDSHAMIYALLRKFLTKMRAAVATERTLLAFTSTTTTSTSSTSSTSTTSTSSTTTTT
jgi:hypothetical protein